MGYPVVCNNCGHTHTAWNIVDLIKNHVDKDGKLVCRSCGGDGHIHRKSQTQDGKTWSRYIHGVVPFKTQYGRKYVPYVFLLSYSPKGKPTDVHLNYYKDFRPDGGNLKHGHGPGGAPVFGRNELRELMRLAIKHGIVSMSDFRTRGSRYRPVRGKSAQ